MSKDHGASDMLMAFGAGALLGAVAALLLAPKSGAETRRDLGDLAGTAMERGRTAAERAREKARMTAENAGEFVRDQKERVGSAIQEGKEAYMRETAKS